MESVSQVATRILLLVLLSTMHASTAAQSNKIRLQVNSEDGRLTVPELVTKYGYGVEEHPITTDDGYRLILHRVNSENTRPNATVVLLMHGLLCSSADWVVIGPGNALAYLLADRGYDVWLGNARGNRYSRKHDNMDPKGTEFWKFSWHEIGLYDLPATIDYILKRTQQRRLHYVGHSQGTTAFFVMTTMRPEYNEKVIEMQALAPVAFMEHMSSPLLKLMTRFLNTLNVLFSLFGIAEFLPNTPILQEVATRICPPTATTNLCMHLLFLLSGYDPTQLDPALVPILLGHTPAGAATKQVVHFAQGVRSKRFQHYNYGKVKNLVIYGKISPPEYNLTQITVPIMIYYGLNDLLAAPDDVHRLAASLPNLQQKVQVNHARFNHLDFLLANDVRTLLYDGLIERITTVDKHAAN
ncbi:lipase 1-like [Anopheles aquasalis]|uniref:lipase 1-like n=1 Tax=Anopheles aquasalis TaxID=42839 RepID=UPI00215B0C5B|nr:lipase 1-like [Anopheles aquasalis]